MKKLANRNEIYKTLSSLGHARFHCLFGSTESELIRTTDKADLDAADLIHNCMRQIVEED